MRLLFLAALLLFPACNTAPQKNESKRKVDAVALSPRVQEPAHLANQSSFEEPFLRVMARRRSSEDIETLKRLLSSSDNERLWATFGLGLHCAEAPNIKKKTQVLTSLLSALASWVSNEPPPAPSLLRTIGWSIGACASEDAEGVLRSFLAPSGGAEQESLIDVATYGLAALADRKGTLSERTQTAILNSAARESRSELLLPLGRMGRLSRAVGAHLLEVTGPLLTSKRKEGRRHAIFALGNAGPSAASPLAQILLADKYTPQERAAAAQALGHLGEAGQEALDDTLADILARGLPIEFDRALWVPLRAIVQALQSPNKSTTELAQLSSVVLSEGKGRKKSSQRRRMVWLRCEAAQLVAQGDYTSNALLACDPNQGRPGSLALLKSLTRQPLVAKRLTSYTLLAKNKDPVIAQAALRLIPSHPELVSARGLLAHALRTGSPGTQATAAQVISAYPNRALKAHSPEEGEVADELDIVKLLGELLDESAAELPIETRAAIISAAGALQALSLKPALEHYCRGTEPALWRPAKRALSLLGKETSNCPPDPVPSAPTQHSEPFAHETAITLLIDSDVGPLEIELNNLGAPASTARLLHLVETHFYDGIAVHNLRPGFAVQFGDKDGDGYEDSLTESIPHEISPDPFISLSVGMSAFSPGSQNSQIFVLVSDAPQLTGSRIHLGRAKGPWHLLNIGDIFHTVRRK